MERYRKRMEPYNRTRAVRLAQFLAACLLLIAVALVSRREIREAPEPNAYDFKLLYLILFDDAHGPVLPEEMFARRLAHLEAVLERESFGRIRVSPRLTFLHARELGDDRLAYSSRGVVDWITALEAHCARNGTDYDILVFSPASEAYGPWCTDGPSQGYSRNGRKYLCMEAFLDPARKEEDGRAVALAIHKILHGFGYNHISQENRPSNLLEWSIGLPKTRILPLCPREEGAPLLFDKHIMKVLGFLPRNGFEEACPDRRGLVCEEESGFLCANSYDIRCIDSDRDGVVDSADDYLFTPYGSAGAADTDRDGIPDRLDLCDGDEVRVFANIRLMKSRAIVDRDRVEIRFEPASRIRGVNLQPARNLGGFIGFLKKEVTRITGSELSLDAESLSSITRLKVFYDSPQGPFYRPFYLYREPQEIEYVHEKEWYYFSRFGCDIPLGVRFSESSTYDRDLNGLPDGELFPFARKITDGYDWDSDGIPDLEDSLPTVHGRCGNRSVRGVPDSDGDGLCDPALFRFAETAPGLMEGDLAISFLEDAEADRCPYVRGTNGEGCP
jgi:hypothetical protein